jgi:replicative DNA helicase
VNDHAPHLEAPPPASPEDYGDSSSLRDDYLAGISAGRRDREMGLLPDAVLPAETPHREPPHNLEAEQALLGAILVNNRAFDRVCDFLRPEHFADPVHGRIFGACASLINSGKIATWVTLKGMFDQDEVLTEQGGATYLVKLAASVVTVINAEDYGREIRDCALRRELIDIAETAVNDAFDRDVEGTVEVALEKLHARLDALATSPDGRGGPISSADGAASALTEIENAWRNGGKLVGISTGLVDLDDLTGGMANGDLILVAARPGMGKSSLLRTTLWEHVSAGGRALMFSPEMTVSQHQMALMAARAGIDIKRLRRGQIEQDQWQALHDAKAIVGSMDLKIDEREAPSLAYIRSVLRRLRGDKKPTLVAVDYLQLMSAATKSDRKVDQIGEISAGLKSIAKEMNVPVVALCQLNRALESRDDRRPMLSDLRDSGNLEQDADQVLFLYRDEYYLEREEPKQKASEGLLQFEERRSKWLTRMESARGAAEVICAKNRLGPLGVCKLRFDGPTLSFSNLAHSDDQQEANW